MCGNVADNRSPTDLQPNPHLAGFFTGKESVIFGIQYIAMYSILTTSLFDDWFAGLKDRLVKQRIQARIDRVEDGNLGDHKAVGDGVSEMRLSFGAGWRIYYTMRGLEIVVLLAGGDKSNQQSDIELAKALAKQLKE